jgi:hypothetical protein
LLYFFEIFFETITFALVIQRGGLAQLARALAWHARGHRFDSVILHYTTKAATIAAFVVCEIYTFKKHAKRGKISIALILPLLCGS